MLKRLFGLLALLLVLAACTQSGAPAVSVTVSPEPGEADVAVTSAVTATFSAAMNESTLEGAFTLASEAGDVDGSVAYDDAQRTLTFTPGTDLEYETEYTATITRTVRSAAGGRLAGPASGVYAWSFTTEEAPASAGEVTSVTVTPASAELAIGESQQFQAAVVADDGVDTSVTWASSAVAVATVDDAGNVTAVGAGVATITATSVADGDFSDSAEVTVIAPEVTGITIEPATLSFLVGDDPQQLTANVEAAGGADETVTWATDDADVATVDNTGLVTAVGVGSATITAESVFTPGVTGTATVNVADAPEVFGVTLAPDEADLEIGEAITLIATVDAVGGAAETVNWASTNDAVAEVVDGVVTAVASGVATISATSTVNAAAVGEATITVLAPDVTAVEVSPEELTLGVGDDPAQFTATVTAVSGADEAVTWGSDDEDVAAVDADGLVTAMSAGTATITATSDFNPIVSGSATVNVPGVTGIVVTPPENDLAAGNVVQLLAVATLVHGATDDSVTWSSSDETVATVDAAGLVTALAEGAATITATSVMTPASSGSAEVTVHPAVSAADYVTDAAYLEGDAVALAAPVVTGGLAPFTYALTSGALPAGVDLNADGTISGAATESGDFTAEVTVTDDLGQTDTAEVTLAIIAPMVVELFIDDTVVHLTDFTPQSLIVSGGLAPFTFVDEIIDPADPEWADRYADGTWGAHDPEDQGDLAPGMVIDENTGAISGAATTLGFHRTYVRVTDSLGQTDVAMFEIDVDPAELVLTYDPATYSYARGSAFTVSAENVTVTGGVTPYEFSWEIENCGTILLDCEDTYWGIDSINGEIERTSGGGGGILDNVHNTDRSYIVTVTDNEGETATFEVSFEED